MAVLVGLTGGMASGKSAVAALFRRRGALVIDADQVVRSLLGHGGAALPLVARRFGSGMVTRRGVDRQALAPRVFADPAALDMLEKTLHPLAAREVRRRVRRAARRRVIVVEAPLLIEAGWHRWVDVVVTVRASRQQQIARALARPGMTRAGVLARIRRQLPFAAKRLCSDYVVDNRGPLSGTDKQVQRIWENITTGCRQGGRV